VKLLLTSFGAIVLDPEDHDLIVSLTLTHYQVTDPTDNTTGVAS
jgi:hypothetical protein